MFEDGKCPMLFTDAIERYKLSDEFVDRFCNKGCSVECGKFLERELKNKTTKELRTMLIKLIYKILKKLIDNCDKFYLEETDPDVIEAKELLGRVEKAMKAKGDDANAHQ